jgi:hypothetical protein
VIRFADLEALKRPARNSVRNPLRSYCAKNFTETGWAITGNPVGLGQLPVKYGSSTVAMPGYDLRVVDETSLHPQGVRTVGEDPRRPRHGPAWPRYCLHRNRLRMPSSACRHHRTARRAVHHSPHCPGSHCYCCPDPANDGPPWLMPCRDRRPFMTATDSMARAVGFCRSEWHGSFGKGGRR